MPGNIGVIESLACFSRFLMALAIVLFIPTLQGCGIDSDATEPSLGPVIEELAIVDSFGPRILVRDGAASGVIRMIVGETAELQVSATLDGSPLPSGSKVVDVRMESPYDVDISIAQNTRTFILRAARPVSTQFAVTLDIPGNGIYTSPPLRFEAVPRTPIAGVLVTTETGGRYQQLGADESGSLLLSVERPMLVEVTPLDVGGEPIAIGLYTHVRVTGADPVSGVTVEPIPSQSGVFQLTATRRVYPVWLIARVERGGGVIYTSNPFRLLIQGQPDVPGSWNGFDADQAPRSVTDLLSWNGLLVASGEFESIGDIAAQGIAAWNGLTWGSLGAGPERVRGLVNASGELLAITDQGIYRWNTHEWVAFDPSASQDPAFFRLQGHLYVQAKAGTWRRDSSTSWTALGYWMAAYIGPSGPTVFAYREHDDGDYGGGLVEYWNGEEWIRTHYWQDDGHSATAELRPVSGRLFLLIHEGGEMGEVSHVEEWTGAEWELRFQRKVGQHYRHVLLWQDRLLAVGRIGILLDGEEQSIGAVTPSYSTVRTATVHDGRLYLFGSFTRVNDVVAPRIAYYVLG